MDTDELFIMVNILNIMKDIFIIIANTVMESKYMLMENLIWESGIMIHLINPLVFDQNYFNNNNNKINLYQNKIKI